MFYIMIKAGDKYMLVNSKDMLLKAKEGKYAIPQFNINNLEWTKYILEECSRVNCPVILGVSEGAAKYMGGFQVVASMVQGMLNSLNPSVDVVLHLDHGHSIETCKQAIDAGFTSVMIDGSTLPLQDNIALTKEVVAYAHQRNITVEGEVGCVGGEEDGFISEKLYARYEDVLRFCQETDVDTIAPALGSVHGIYKGEPKLDFDTMKRISESVSIPLVLHGGSGIPDAMIQKAIFCGICKININTELQQAWHNGVLEFISENKEVYDPRKVIGSGEKPMKAEIDHKIQIFFSKYNGD